MKNLLFYLTIALSLAVVSCNKTPDNKIHATKVEKGDWVVTTPGTSPVQAEETYVQISPTWGQAFDIASKRGDHSYYVIAGFFLIVAFVVVFVGRAVNFNWLPDVVYHGNFGNIILAVLLAGGVYLTINHALGIKNNNDKWVKKEVYDKAMTEVGSTQPIWDSLQNNCLIIDGPYNCYQK